MVFELWGRTRGKRPDIRKLFGRRIHALFCEVTRRVAHSGQEGDDKEDGELRFRERFVPVME